MKTVNFVLGMHRSGTSALSGVLKTIGLDLSSHLIQKNKWNSKGHFENIDVYRLNEKILHENDSKWDDYSFNLNKINEKNKNNYIEEIKNLIKKTFRYSNEFVIKDPRICLLFPIWEEACLKLGLNIRVILPIRNPMEVAQSLNSRDHFSIEKGLLIWTQHFLSAEFNSRKHKRVFINFDNLINDTKHTVDILYDFLEIKGRRKRKDINDFLDSSLKHKNILFENISKDTPLFFQKIVNYLIKAKYDDYRELDIIRNEFGFLTELFFNPEIIDGISKEQKQIAIISELNNKIKSQLDIIDKTIVDEEYYTARYPTIKNFDIKPKEHYFKYGKAEGRTPNKYCELFKVNSKELTGSDEIIFSLENKIKQLEPLQIKNNELNIQLSEALKQFDKLNKKSTHNEQEIKIKNGSIENFKNNETNFLQELKNNKEELTKSIKIIDEKDRLIQNLETQETNFNHELMIRKNDIQSKSDEILQKNKVITDLKNREKELNEQLKDVDAELQNKISQIKTLSHQNTENTENYKAVINQKDTALNEMYTDLKEYKQSLQNKIDEHNSLKKRLKSIIKKSKKQNKKISQILEEIDILQKKSQVNKNQSKFEIDKKDSIIAEMTAKDTLINHTLKSKNKLLHRKTQEQRETQYLIMLKDRKLKQNQQEIDNLNTTINEIVDDLATIKESKSWKFTRPLRLVPKIFKGNKIEL